MHYKHENDNEVLDLERLVACEAKLVKRLAHGLLLHSLLILDAHQTSNQSIDECRDT